MSHNHSDDDKKGAPSAQKIPGGENHFKTFGEGGLIAETNPRSVWSDTPREQIREAIQRGESGLIQPSARPGRFWEKPIKKAKFSKGKERERNDFNCRSSGSLYRAKEREEEEKKENIIIIGSEFDYDSFWFKMMFMSCGYAVAAGTQKPEGWTDADITTILVTNYGYNQAELNKIQQLEKDGKVTKVVLIDSFGQIIDFLNNRKKDGSLYKINRLAVFTHGYTLKDGSGAIDFNFMPPEYDDEMPQDAKAHPMILDKKEVLYLSRHIFSDTPIFYSYACRTGIGTRGTPKDGNLHAENGLAQFIANYFKIEVRAFYRKTDYSSVLVPTDKNEKEGIEDEITEIMYYKRSSGYEGQSFRINEEYEALYHEGSGYSHYNHDTARRIGAWGYGPNGENVNDYSLWRKGGARSLPVAVPGSDKIPGDFAIFKPDEK